MQRSASPVLASARTVKIDGKDYKYGPLPYRARGELENLYFPNARSPHEKMVGAIAKLTDAEQDDYAESVEQIKRLSLGWEPNLESDDAYEFFSKSTENWGAFLGVVLPLFNTFREDVDFVALAGGMSKGDRDEMFAQCLEIGAYLPKWLSRAAAGDR